LSLISNLEEKDVTHKAGRSALVALIAAASIALGAGASSGAPVTIKANFLQRWDPPSKTVAKGTKVVWKNPTLEQHPIRAYGGNWSFKAGLGPNDSIARRFKQTGTFKFRCKIHGSTQRVDGKLVCTGMCGKVKVTK
jgi:plastocyanin